MGIRNSSPLRLVRSTNDVPPVYSERCVLFSYGIEVGTWSFTGEPDFSLCPHCEKEVRFFTKDGEMILYVGNSGAVVLESPHAQKAFLHLIVSDLPPEEAGDNEEPEMLGEQPFFYYRMFFPTTRGELTELPWLLSGEPDVTVVSQGRLLHATTDEGHGLLILLGSEVSLILKPVPP